MVSRASKQEYHNKIIKALLKIANFEKKGNRVFVLLFLIDSVLLFIANTMAIGLVEHFQMMLDLYVDWMLLNFVKKIIHVPLVY